MTLGKLRSYSKELLFVLITVLFVSYLISLHSSPARTVQSYAHTQAIEYVSIPDMPTYTASMVPAEESSGIVCLLLEKKWFWWEVATVSIPGNWVRPIYDRYLTPVSEHDPVYAAVLDLPARGHPLRLKMVWGETIMDGKIAHLKTKDQDMEFAIVPAESSGYFYFFIPEDQYIPVGKSLSIELSDGRIIPVNHYPFY
jgi:hypothetical protein